MVDVDDDGCDEIVYGVVVIDDDGKGFYFIGWGYGDVLYVSDYFFENFGFEVFSI